MEQPLELWELAGSHWQLPIIVEIHADMARVTIPDIPLLGLQRAALENALSQLATGGTETERLIPIIVLKEFAQKSKFESPEQVVAWNRLPSPAINFPKDEGVDEFIKDWLAASGISLSKAAASTLFVSLVTHMMHWLVNRRKPVNLLFGTLDPFQYRKNWKEIVLGMAYARTAEADTWHKKFVEQHPPTPTDLCQSQLLSFDRGICRWMVEFTPAAWFHKHSDEVEWNRRKRLGGKAYLVSVCRVIMGHAERAVSVYRKFLHEQSTKIVSLPEFDVFGSGFFGKVKADSKEKVHRPFRTYVLPTEVAASIQSSAAEDSIGADGELP